MEQLLICVSLAILGLCMGSFAGATVWRLRARQLVEDKEMGEKVDSREYKKLSPLTKSTFASDRSRCLHCEHTLAWYDLLPLVSWLSTKGKCRYCHKKIGWFEPVIELSVAALFVSLYLLWPYEMHSIFGITHFILWLIAGIMLAILFAYDLKWYLLPNYIVFPLIAIGAVVAAINIIEAPDTLAALLDVLFSCITLSGIYFGLWLLSKGQWIGFGDVKLGLGLALLLSDWKLAFIALFAANFIGCLIVIPGMIAKKIDRKTRVPFGPLLIAGSVLSLLIGRYIIDLYFIGF